MDSNLQKELVGKYIQAPISVELKESIENGPPAEESNSMARDFYGTQTYNPVFDYIWKTHTNQPGQWFGSEWRIAKYAEDNSILEENISSSGKKLKTKKADVFRKVIHLLSPVSIMEDAYAFPKTPGLPWHTRPSYNAFNKVNSPFNQAYIDVFASYLASRLAEKRISPHFVPFYGALTTMAKTYLYNITEDYASYRKERWFWNSIQAKNINFHIIDNEGEPITDPKMIFDITTRPSDDELNDDSDDSCDDLTISDDIDSKSHTFREEPVNNQCFNDLENAEINMDSLQCDINNVNNIEADYEGDDEGDDDQEDEDDDGPNIYLEFNNMPTMMAFYERQDGCMDDLLYDNEEVGK